MSPGAEPADPEPPPSLEDLVTEFIEQRERGAVVDAAAFAARYPKSEADLLAALGRVDQAFAMFPSDGTNPLPATIGSFRVCGEIGRGGMGLVLRVESAGLPGVPLALKLLSAPSSFNPRAVERLRREGEVLRRLAHPNIVHIVEIGEVDHTPYLVMDLVDGPSLATVITAARANGRGTSGKSGTSGTSGTTGTSGTSGTSTATGTSGRTSTAAGALCGRDGARGAARVIAALARAVAAAHAAALLHRDIKPGNIMLRRTGEPVLIDFGLAGGDAGSTLTQTGDVLGTPQYMAPEQAAGRGVGPPADIYSLGAVLYELLTLRPPRGEGGPATILEAVRNRPIPPIRRVDPELPRALETIVLRATASRPERRYPNAAALAGDLDAFLRGDRVVARRPSPAERAADAWRFHGRTMSIGAAVTLAVVTAAVLLSLDVEDDPRQRAALDEVAMAWAARDGDALATAAEAYAATGAAVRMVAVIRSLATGRDIPLEPDDAGTAAGVLAAGLRQYRAKEYARAAETLQQAAALAPGTSLPVVVRGFAARRAGQLEIAEAELRGVARRLPGSAAVRVELSRVLRTREKYQAAEEVLREALELSADDAEIWHDLARVRYTIVRARPKAEQDFAAGLRAAERAVELAGDGVSASMLRTEAKLLDSNARFAEAEAIYRELLRRDPGSVQDRFMLAYCLDSAHRIREAKVEYETLCAKLPDHPRPRLCLAYLHAGSDPECAECSTFFADHPALLDVGRAEELLLEAIRLNRGADEASVLTAVHIARRIERHAALDELLGALIDESADAGDDQRIITLTKARRTLTR